MMHEAINMIMGLKNWSYEEKLIKQITSHWNQNLLGKKIGRNKYPEPYIKKKNTWIGAK